MRLFYDGGWCHSHEIDKAIFEFGYPMGPFQMFDLAGGDIGWAMRKRLEPMRDKNERYVHIPDKLCEKGWFGQKTGRGFYRYDKGNRRGDEDPEVLEIINLEMQKKDHKTKKLNTKRNN